MTHYADTDDLKQAEQCARRLLRLNPKYSVAKPFLVLALLWQDKNGEALELARRYCRDEPTATNQHVLAKALIYNDRHGEAEALLRQAVKDHPDDLECRLVLVHELLVGEHAEKRHAEAEELLSVARGQLARDTRRSLFVGCAQCTIVCLALQGKVAESLEVFPQIIPWSEEEADQMRKLRAAFSP